MKLQAWYLAPLAVVSAAIVLIITSLLLWSSSEADRISEDRERGIVRALVEQSADRIAHTQESSTIWDDSVTQVARRPLDMNWLDLNLGTWFSDYAHFDAVYILSSQNEPLYAMQGGVRVSPQAYGEVAGAIGPIVAAFREGRTASSRRLDAEIAMLAPGSSDLVLIGGQPAVVSVKPIVGDTGRMTIKPRQASVHIAVRYLDATFFGRVSEVYGLTDAHYVARPPTTPGLVSVPLQRSDGKVVGYAAWRALAPGHQVIMRIGPALLVSLVLAGAAFLVLALRLARRTLDLEESRRQAQHLALHDSLTALPNRAHFDSEVDAALLRCQDGDGRIALLFIDLDRFKQINDTFGHPGGNALLCEVARRLLAELRGSDIVARIGGDEFAVLLSHAEDEAVVQAICARLVAELGRGYLIEGKQAFIGASIGVAMAPRDAAQRVELIRKADIALYKAKLRGRGQFVFFEPAMDEVIRRREATNRDLRAALSDCAHHFRVLYQPVYSASNGRLVGIEALLRWNHPEHGAIAPDEFIQAAEDSGLIEDLGHWVLREALRQARDWPALRLAVNVSAVQVRSRRFVEDVAMLLEQTGVEPRRLELEITETALMSGWDDVIQTLARLRDMGVSIALDDFGTGYSSLSHIRDVAVDRIKIDRSFVASIDHSGPPRSGHGSGFIEALVTLARARGLAVTAEGVETRRQLQLLLEAGCQHVQGFLLSPPVEADAVAELNSRSLLLAGMATRFRRVA